MLRDISFMEPPTYPPGGHSLHSRHPHPHLHILFGQLFLMRVTSPAKRRLCLAPHSDASGCADIKTASSRREKQLPGKQLQSRLPGKSTLYARAMGNTFAIQTICIGPAYFFGILMPGVSSNSGTLLTFYLPRQPMTGAQQFSCGMIAIWCCWQAATNWSTSWRVKALYPTSSDATYTGIYNLPAVSTYLLPGEPIHHE